MKRARSLDDVAPGSSPLLQVDPSTGVLLDHDGAWATNGERHYLCFPSEALARAYAAAQLRAVPLAEWWLLDAEGAPRDVLRDHSALAREAERAWQARARKQGWWRRLFPR